MLIQPSSFLLKRQAWMIPSSGDFYSVSQKIVLIEFAETSGEKLDIIWSLPAEVRKK